MLRLLRVRPRRRLKCAVAIGGVGCVAARGREVERVVGGGGAVVGQVAGIVRISLA